MQRRTTRPTRIAAALTVAGLGLAPLATPALAAPDKPGPRYSAGAAGAGDPYLPEAGNGGIDVEHYSLDLTYTLPDAEPAPLEGDLQGVATITLTATEDLHSFNLDLRGLTATKVTVDGKPARFEHEGTNELVITPRPKLKEGTSHEVVVTYGGTTGVPVDLEGTPVGWVTTRDGAMVVSEPDGAATWFPNSDHPTDKATYDFDVTVPEGSVAVANGVLTGSETVDGWTTWSWDAPDPMASYLATASVGNFELRSSVSPSGVPIIDAIDKDLADSASADLAHVGDMMSFYEDLFGAYPFETYGAIVDDDSVGYALEVQTRSVFSKRAKESTVAHELVHQWMGDDVSVTSWADIWHNEGWAVYGTWLWEEHRGGPTVDEAFQQVMEIPADDEFWHLEIGDPGPMNLFHDAIYDRSGAMLYALREKMGDEAFLSMTRRITSERSGGNISTEQFMELAEEESGLDLDNFFEVWLFTPEKPTEW